jgi:hypothetical protein
MAGGDVEPLAPTHDGRDVDLAGFVVIRRARIVDEVGQCTMVCIDGRKDSPTRYRLFQQARHPNQSGAVLVELGAVEEGIVISLLSNFLDSAGPKALDQTEYGWESARETRLRFGEPESRGEKS